MDRTLRGASTAAWTREHLVLRALADSALEARADVGLLVARTSAADLASYEGQAALAASESGPRSLLDMLLKGFRPANDVQSALAQVSPAAMLERAQLTVDSQQELDAL